MTTTFIVLLRAVNAGGVNSLPTKDFIRLLVEAMQIELIQAEGL